MAKQKRKVLICGAGIAGTCLANLLNRIGFATTVIEKAAHFRTGGQNIDVHGAGRKIVERMGLLDQIKARHTSECGMRVVDSNGTILEEFPQDSENDAALTKELEILRSDLARIFYESTIEETVYRFGLSMKAYTQVGNRANVEFSDGSVEDFDLVVCAEGVGSPTRNLIMSERFRVEYLGFWMGFFRIPKISTDDNWSETYWRKGGPGLLIRPSTVDSRGVLVTFKSDDSSFNYRGQSEQRRILADVLDGAGWQCKRVIENLNYDDDLYLGPLLQIKADTWSKGSFVLLGDAGYSPSVLTGRGTTLAITGAYVLAGELSRAANISDALQSYENTFRSFAETCQIVSPDLLNLLDFSSSSENEKQEIQNFATVEGVFDLPDYGF